MHKERLGDSEVGFRFQELRALGFGRQPCVISSLSTLDTTYKLTQV